MRNIYRKFIITLLPCALLTPYAAATEKQPITWWYEAATPFNQKVLTDNLITPFNKQYPQYQLSIDYRGSEVDRQVRVALLSNTGPDIVYTAGPSYVAAMARAGKLLPLDDQAAKLKWNERILPLFIEMGKYNGKLYSLPKSYESMGLFYNKTLFAREHWTAPKTLAEMETLAEAMKAKGITPFVAGNAGWRATNEHYVTLVFNAIAGPDNVYKALKGQLPWTAPPFVDAISRLLQWWKQGYFGRNYFSLDTEQAFAQLATGKAGMAPTGTWAFSWVPGWFPANHAEPGMVPFPSLHAGDEVAWPLGVGSTLSVSAASKNPDGAVKVIDAIFRQDFYSRMNSLWPGEWNLPLRDLSKVKFDSNIIPLYVQTMKEMSNAIADGHYGYTTWSFMPPAADAWIVNGIEQVWLEKITPLQFLQKLDQIFRQELAEGKVPAIPPRR